MMAEGATVLEQERVESLGVAPSNQQEAGTARTALTLAHPRVVAIHSDTVRDVPTETQHGELVAHVQVAGLRETTFEGEAGVLEVSAKSHRMAGRLQILRDI